jgi:hypothetical protein
MRSAPSTITTMEPISSRFTAITHAPLPLAPPANAWHARIGALYARSQKDRALFGSPLGPFYFDGQPGWLPRFVFFGPQASDESWRLAFLAGSVSSNASPSTRSRGTGSTSLSFRSWTRRA